MEQTIPLNHRVYNIDNAQVYVGVSEVLWMKEYFVVDNAQVYVGVSEVLWMKEYFVVVKHCSQFVCVLFTVVGQILLQ